MNLRAVDFFSRHYVTDVGFGANSKAFVDFNGAAGEDSDNPLQPSSTRILSFSPQFRIKISFQFETFIM